LLCRVLGLNRIGIRLLLYRVRVRLLLHRVGIGLLRYRVLLLLRPRVLTLLRPWIRTGSLEGRRRRKGIGRAAAGLKTLELAHQAVEVILKAGQRIFQIVEQTAEVRGR
jgi:hypothetical protein